MGLRSALSRLAAGAPVPVFVVGGAGTAAATRALRLRDEVDVVESPRAADVLVVVTPLPDALNHAARQVHDQLSSPRLTVLWPGDGDATPWPPSALVSTGGVDDLVATVVAAHRDLLVGATPGEGILLPDEDAVAWRGEGPYGHGGKGMTGGVPFGRPLTGRAPDRDGLQLDQVEVTVGPWFPALPPGLVLTVKLQGDVVQEVVVRPNPFEAGAGGAPDEPFARALAGPVAVAELESARARHHLGWLGDALRVQGLDALGRRTLALADGLTPADGAAVADLIRAIRRSGVLVWSLGPGRLDPAVLTGRSLGPVGRAAGMAVDARALDPAYAGLGFEPVVGDAGDTRARWQQRLAEVVQSLDLAVRAGDRRTTRTDVVESPRGPIGPGSPTPSADLIDLVPPLVTGLEWGDAVAAIVSLDLDVAEAASRRPSPAPTGATT